VGRMDEGQGAESGREKWWEKEGWEAALVLASWRKKPGKMADQLSEAFHRVSLNLRLLIPLFPHFPEFLHFPCRLSSIQEEQRRGPQKSPGVSRATTFPYPRRSMTASECRPSGKLAGGEGKGAGARGTSRGDSAVTQKRAGLR
jgi:hypothetical protein